MIYFSILCLIFFYSHWSNVQCYTTFIFCFPIFAENIWALRAPPVLTFPVQPPGASDPCPSFAGVPVPAMLQQSWTPAPHSSALPWALVSWAHLWDHGREQCPRAGLPCVSWLPCSWLRMGWTLPPRPSQGSMCCCWPLPCSLGESVLCCSTVIINIPLCFFSLQY